MAFQFSNVRLFASQINFTDCKRALVGLGIDVRSVLKAMTFNNARLVVFRVGRVICSRFVSFGTILSARLKARIESAKAVQFEFVNKHPNENVTIAETTTGHTITIDHDAHSIDCDCPDIGSIELNGIQICKHTIATMKSFFDISSLSKMLEWYNQGW